MTWAGHRRGGGNTAAYRELRKRVLSRDGYQCRIGIPGVCTGTATAMDHIIPIAEGGSMMDEANCRAACRPCNTRLGQKLGGARTAVLTGKWSRAW